MLSVSPETTSVTLLPAGVSFLICTYNSASRIEETLACLAQQVASFDIAQEVILVDNACTDNTASVAETYWAKLGIAIPLRIFFEHKPGKNFAIVTAFKQARYRYACIVDDDNRLDKDYLQIGYGLLESNPRIGLLGGQTEGDFEVPPPNWFSTFQPFYAVGAPLDLSTSTPLVEGAIGENVLWGAGMFVRMELWNRLQKLSFKSLFVGRQGIKNLTAGEDDELCYAAQLLGYEVWYSPKLSLRHYMTASRLTEAYRDKLFYATARSQARTKIYRDVLWGEKTKNYGSITNLAKDLLYMGRNVVKQFLSFDYLHALSTKKSLATMRYYYQLLVLCDFLVNFNKLNLYYKEVYNFKKKIYKLK